MDENYNHITGRKELFFGAPSEAMVVLEHENGEDVYFATEHQMGAQYWMSDGTPGRRTGLIALFKHTRVVARRTLKGCATAKPPISVSAKRLQAPLVKVVAEVRAQKQATEKPKPKPTEKSMHDPVLDRPTKPAKSVLAQSDAQANADGFTSLLDVAKAGRWVSGQTFISVNRNGNITVAKAIADKGDLVDLQFCQKTMQIRVGKVSSGGKKLGAGRMMSARYITGLFAAPEDGSSLRVPLVRKGGWFYGKVDLKLDDGELE